LKILSGRNIGYLYCQAGELIEAEANGSNGKQAAFQILSWDKPLICVEYGLQLKERTIQGPLMSLLLESGRISDEKENETSEKRRYKRTACSLAAEFDVNEWTYKGTICDISLGGSFIKTNEPISVGQKINLTLFSQSLEKSIAVGGKIVRRSQEGIGVEFGALSMNQKNIIRTVIEEAADS
jgi:Tfp pilus assembly protein PilZ